MCVTVSLQFTVIFQSWNTLNYKTGWHSFHDLSNSISAYHSLSREVCKHAVIFMCFCMDLMGQTRSAGVWFTQCNGLTYIVHSNAILVAATLLITKTPSDRLFDQFYTGSYKLGELFSFYFLKTKCLVKNFLRQ